MPQKSKGIGAAKGPKAAISKSLGKSPKTAKAAKVEKPAKAMKPVKVKAVEKPTPVKEKEIAKAKTALKATEPTPAATAPAKESTKPARSKKISVSVSANEASSALAQKWATLFKKSEQIESKPYNMKAAFEEKTAIVHKVLGWGYILANRNDRLEVLFKDGIKYLISNYKP